MLISLTIIEKGTRPVKIKMEAWNYNEDSLKA
jgi:hypothetical protein